MVEHRTVDAVVVGSKPISHPELGEAQKCASPLLGKRKEQMV